METRDDMIRDAAAALTWGEQFTKRKPQPVPVVPVLATDSAERKSIPICSGVIDYFPLALAEVAALSHRATQQHHPNDAMHWDRTVSLDHADTMMRHLVDRGTIDTDGIRHSAKVVWRALAMLQQELEDAGGKPGRGSRF